jgi:hypothetical protein
MIKLVKNIQHENDFVIFKLIHYKFKFPYLEHSSRLNRFSI